MAEELKINIDVATADAAQNAMALVPIIGALNDEAEGLAKGMIKAEGALARMAGGATKAGDASEEAAAGAKALAASSEKVAETANAAAKNVEKLGEAADATADDLADNAQAGTKAAEATAELADEAKEAAISVGAAGSAANSASVANDKLTEATEKVTQAQQGFTKTAPATADAAKQVGRAIEDTGRKTKDAGDQAEQGTKKLTEGLKAPREEATQLEKSLSEVRNILLSFATAGFGLQLISNILQQLNERAKALAEALRKLGEEQLKTDKGFQDIVDNLGFSPDDTGRKRARGFGLKFAGDTGTTPEQAAQILAGAQGAGFSVADASKPESDGTLPGYGIASELAKFAARTRLDPDTAGQLFKLLAQEQVKTPEQARKVLSQIEAGQNSTAISSPSEFVKNFVRVAAGRPAGTLDQSLGQFAAAAVGDPSPERAATRVEQFRAAAQGTPTTLARLGQAALDAGVLNDKQVDELTPKSDKAGDFTRRQDALDRAQQGIADRLAEREARLKTAQERLKLDEQDFANDQNSPAFLKKSEADRKNEVGRRTLDFRTRREDLAREFADLNRERQDAAAKAKADADDLAEQKSGDAATLRAKALAAAYQKLTPQQQEGFLQTTLQGKSDAERRAFIASITEGQEGRGALNAITAPAGTAAFAGASAAARNADPSVTASRNNQYLYNNALARDQREKNNALRANNITGVEYTASIQGTVDRDIETLIARGSGKTMGLVGEWSPTMEVPGTIDYGAAPTKEGLRARRTALLVLNQFRNLRAQLTPEQYAAIDDGSFGKWIEDTATRILDTPQAGFDGGYGGSLRLEQATQLATAFGAFLERASKAGTDKGFALPDFQGVPVGPEGNSFVPKTPAASTKPASVRPPMRVPAGPTASATPGTSGPPPVGPQASAAPTTVNYNVNIGTHVGQDLGTWEFPSRLQDV